MKRISAYLRVLARGVGLCALALGACDIPTSLPKGWDSQFRLSGDPTTVSVASLLPSEVTVTTGTPPAFQLTLPSANSTQTLGALCPACAAANGLTLPKPAFNATFTTTTALPSDVVSVSLQGGTVSLALTNGFNFDPLRPSATARGSITINLRSGTTSIAAPTVINGTTTAFAPGTQITRDITLNSATIGGTITAEVTIDSPAGDPITIDTSRTLQVAATPVGVTATSVNVRVPSRTVTFTSTELDLEDVEEDVTDHLIRGTVILGLENPFAVTGNVTLRFTAPGVNITKSFAVASGSSTVSLTLTKDELRQMFGNTLQMELSGQVVGQNAITVTPSQAITVTPTLDVVVALRDCSEGACG